MNIVLIGFRCAGKTSVGKELADRLGRPFIDCDEYIEKKTNLTIREIFDIAGESYFRMLEGDAIADLCKMDHRVIATGGGAVLKYKNIRNLKQNGFVIYLDTSAAALLVDRGVSAVVLDFFPEAPFWLGIDLDARPGRNHCTLLSRAGDRLDPAGVSGSHDCSGRAALSGRPGRSVCTQPWPPHR